MDKLPWFKFLPTDWIMGKIQRCPEVTQARFMRLICLYWNKECVLTFEDAEIEIDKEHLDILISKKIIKLVDNFISIEFLNEQLENISETSQKRRDAVLLRWARVKQNDTSVSIIDTSVLQNDTEKRREEEIRKDKYNNNDLYFNELMSSETWLETCAMQNQPKFNIEEVKEKLLIFKNDLNLKLDIKQQKKEFTTHFVRWLNQQTKNNNSKKYNIDELRKQFPDL